MNPRLVASAALAGALFAAPSHAQPTTAALAQAPVEHLKLVYLHCDRVTSRERVDPNQFAQCAMVGDELLRRGFGGDFDRLLAWWRGERAKAGAPVAAIP